MRIGVCNFHSCELHISYAVQSLWSFKQEEGGTNYDDLVRIAEMQRNVCNECQFNGVLVFVFALVFIFAVVLLFLFVHVAAGA